MNYVKVGVFEKFDFFNMGGGGVVFEGGGGEKCSGFNTSTAPPPRLKTANFLHQDLFKGRSPNKIFRMYRIGATIQKHGWTTK